jgi:hypothetical protein
MAQLGAKGKFLAVPKFSAGEGCGLKYWRTMISATLRRVDKAGVQLVQNKLVLTAKKD